MNILNFGSLNLDFVYSVDHIVTPGETINSRNMEIFCGGKGLNQSLALARAGATVHQAGSVGTDGERLIDLCRRNGIDVSRIQRLAEPSGNAIIQLADDGQNSIVLFGGANRKQSLESIDTVLADFQKGDYLLLQNEINLVDRLIEEGRRKGMLVVLNPSPWDEELKKARLDMVSVFIMNEVEGAQMTGESDPDRILSIMQDAYPEADVVLTLGSKGAVFQNRHSRIAHGIYPMEVVDTTGAGDTFTGYFLAAAIEGQSPAEALELASAAAAIAVSRLGAAPSIPFRSEVETALAEWRD